MRPIFVVLAPPFFNSIAGISHRQEPRRIEALGTHTRVRCFDESVVRGLSWPRDVDLDTVQIGPLVEHPAAELRAIVHPQTLRLAARADELIANVSQLEGAEIRSRSNRNCLSNLITRV